MNIFIADTIINKNPTSQKLADIAIQSAAEVSKLGLNPRVSLISLSNFGSLNSMEVKKIADAVNILDMKHVDFEYEGEILIEFTLNPSRHYTYPFSRLKNPTNYTSYTTFLL